MNAEIEAGNVKIYSFEFVPIGRLFPYLVQKVYSREGVERREREATVNGEVT